ncbi:hypothetical protein TELCIR_06237 [Teladorsagia circumcincta]|uniref:SXP/RAL-2 family protein Ani s 5-like cation-binding domain-containing protein n=1 Tax=Teladorsagia circumcincta TaxID=45464 RepID=A0A2G9UQV4_TELCI|nr:hypothetical protein TELCIR_06237 [Teladorsagia circumcincta]
MKAALVLFAIATTVAYDTVNFPSSLRYAIYTPRRIGAVYGPVREEYDRILDTSLTIAEERERIMEWAERRNLTKEAIEIFNGMDNRREQIKWNLTKLVVLLPHALERFFSIVEDTRQTHNELTNALNEMEADDPELFRVMRFAMEQFMPRFYPSGRVGGPDHHRPHLGPDPYSPRDFGGMGPPYGKPDGRPWPYSRDGHGDWREYWGNVE